MNEINRPLIIGGGIAGPLAALALQRIGIASTMFEARAADPVGDTGEASGAWLTVAVNGLAAMRALGVHDAVRALGFAAETIELVSGSGKRLGAVPIGGRLDDGTLTLTLQRGALCRCLRDAALAGGARLETGKRLTAIDDDGAGVTARFADGSSARGAFAIGADGVHSRLRRLLDPAAPDARYTGLGNIGGFAPAQAGAGEPGAYRMIFGRRAFFGHVTAPDGGVWWFANPPSARALSRDELAATDWRARLLELAAPDDSAMTALIRATAGPLTCANQYDLGRVDVWQRGRIALIGDAAHAASPSSGQGVSMAAEDAVALAACLQRDADVATALAAFVELRRARAERVVAYGRRFAASKAPGPIGRVVRDLILPFVFARQARATGPDSLAWLYRAPLPALLPPPLSDAAAR